MPATVDLHWWFHAWWMENCRPASGVQKAERDTGMPKKGLPAFGAQDTGGAEAASAEDEVRGIRRLITQSFAEQETYTVTGYDVVYYTNDLNRANSEVLTAFRQDAQAAAQTARPGTEEENYTYGVQRLYAEREGTTETYLYDGRGSVVQLLQGGTVSQSYSYNAYGYINADEYGIQTPFYGYNGEQHDPFTGLQYLRARYYAPQNGSFTTQDSFAGLLTDVLSQNRYTYVENNPLNYIDPTGHVLQKTGNTTSKGGVTKSSSSASTKNTSPARKTTYTSTAASNYVSSAATQKSSVAITGNSKGGKIVSTAPAASVVSNIDVNLHTLLPNTTQYESLEANSIRKDIETIRQYMRTTCNSKAPKYRSIQEPVDVYYGNIWSKNEAEDMNYADKSGDELLRTHYYIAKNYKTQNEKGRLDTLRDLARMTSINDLEMENVLNEMINHFADGTGSDYSNPILTQRVEEHPRTQDYMYDFTEQLKKMISQKNGDIKSFADGGEFHDLLRDNEIFFSAYSYGGNLLDKDTFSGLTMAIHGWTESTVTLTSYEQIGNKYYGTLQFVFSDNFGLDVTDIAEYGYFDGFTCWYILQHYDEYNGQYRPFKTIVSLEYSFEGVIEWKNQKE